MSLRTLSSRSQTRESRENAKGKLLRIYKNPRNTTRKLTEILKNRIPQNIRPYPPDFQPLDPLPMISRSILIRAPRSILNEIKQLPFPKPHPPVADFFRPEENDTIGETVRIYPTTPPKMGIMNRSIKTHRSIKNIREREQAKLNKTRKVITNELKKSTEHLDTLRNKFRDLKKKYKKSQHQAKVAYNKIRRVSNSTEELVGHIDNLKMRKSMTESILARTKGLANSF